MPKSRKFTHSDALECIQNKDLDALIQGMIPQLKHILRSYSDEVKAEGLYWLYVYSNELINDSEKSLTIKEIIGWLIVKIKYRVIRLLKKSKRETFNWSHFIVYDSDYMVLKERIDKICFTPEDREFINLLIAGDSIPEISEKLKIDTTQLYRWRDLLFQRYTSFLPGD